MTMLRIFLLVAVSMAWGAVDKEIAELIWPGNFGFKWAFVCVTCGVIGWYWGRICDWIRIPDSKTSDQIRASIKANLRKIEIYMERHPEDLETKKRYEEIKKEAEKAGLLK